jgi:hypothetical protein
MILYQLTYHRDQMDDFLFFNALYLPVDLPATATQTQLHF